MPSKIPPVIVRVPWLRNLWDTDTNRKTKALLQHPDIKAAIKAERCPICGQLFDECDYFKSINFSSKGEDDV